MIEFRYSNLLFVMGVTFLYSSGMPILYPIAAGFFFVGYWVDKMMLICFFKKPITYDSYLSKRTMTYYKFILVMHVVGGTLMYANSSICPSKVVWMKKANQVLASVSGWQIKNFFQLHIVLFVGLLCLIILVYLFWRVILRVISYFVSCCDKKVAERFNNRFFEASFEKDFYQCVDFRTLEIELDSCLKMIQLYQRIAKKNDPILT
jgi:hypothetical protein